jgi:hypothetical protein
MPVALVDEPVKDGPNKVAEVMVTFSAECVAPRLKVAGGVGKSVAVDTLLELSHTSGDCALPTGITAGGGGGTVGQRAGGERATQLSAERELQVPDAFVPVVMTTAADDRQHNDGFLLASSLMRAVRLVVMPDGSAPVRELLVRLIELMVFSSFSAHGTTPVSDLLPRSSVPMPAVDVCDRMP